MDKLINKIILNSYYPILDGGVSINYDKIIAEKITREGKLLLSKNET